MLANFERGRKIVGLEEIISNPDEAERLVLQFRIELLNRCPEFILNRILYPIAFERAYSKASAREFVLEEHRLFLQDVLDIRPRTKEFEELIGYWPIHPEAPIGAYLRNLATAFETLYRFDEAIEIVVFMAERGLLNYWHSADLFWKAGEIDRGIDLYQKFAKELETRERPSEAMIRISAYLCKMRKVEYSARKRKTKHVPVGPVLKYNGPLRESAAG